LGGVVYSNGMGTNSPGLGPDRSEKGREKVTSVSVDYRGPFFDPPWEAQNTWSAFR